MHPTPCQTAAQTCRAEGWSEPVAAESSFRATLNIYLRDSLCAHRPHLKPLPASCLPLLCIPHKDLMALKSRTIISKVAHVTVP